MGLACSWLRCSWPFKLRFLANLDREGVSVSFWSWNRLGLIHDNCFLSGSTAEMSFPFIQKEKEGFLLFFSSKSPVIMSQGGKLCWQWGTESGVTEPGVRWDGWREDFVPALFLWWESLWSRQEKDFGCRGQLGKLSLTFPFPTVKAKGSSLWVSTIPQHAQLGPAPGPLPLLCLLPRMFLS